MFFFIT